MSKFTKVIAKLSIWVAAIGSSSMICVMASEYCKGVDYTYMLRNQSKEKNS